jgi:hypothetical protein
MLQVVVYVAMLRTLGREDKISHLQQNVKIKNKMGLIKNV